MDIRKILIALAVLTLLFLSISKAAAVFNDNFESGNINAWTSSFVEAGNTLAVEGASAQEGSFGLRVTTGGTNEDAMLRKNIAATNRIFLRSMVRLNSNVGTGFHQIFLSAANSDNPSDSSVIGGLVIRRWSDNLNNNLFTLAGGSFADTGVNLNLNTWYCIEIEVVRDAANGAIRAWVDGTLAGERTGLNTGTTDISWLRLGSDGNPVTSDYSFDDFRSDNAAQTGCGAPSPTTTTTTVPGATTTTIPGATTTTLAGTTTTTLLGSNPPTQIHLSTSTGDPSTEVTATWKTTSMATTSLRIGTSPGNYNIGTIAGTQYSYPDVDTGGTVCCMHAAKATGLTPATRYYYQIGSDAGGWSTEYSFKTAPAKGDRRPFTFAAVADQSWDQDRTATRPIPVSSSIKLDNPELIIVGGDLFYTPTNVEVDRFFNNVISNIASEAYYMASTGNHEAYEPDAMVTYVNRFSYPGRTLGAVCTGTCRETMPELWYSFNWGNVHFVSIDFDTDHGKISSGSTAIRPGEARYDWFKNDLAAAALDKQNQLIDWTVVYVHYCFYNHGKDGDHASDDEERAVLEPLLLQYKVDLVVCGHQHAYQRTFPVGNNGTNVDAASCGGTAGVAYASCTDPQYPIYLMVGTGGRSLYNPDEGFSNPWGFWGTAANPTQWDAFKDNLNFGHARINVNGGTMTVEFVGMPRTSLISQPYDSTATPGRTVIDTFTITKSAVPSTPFCSLSANPTSGIGPFSSTVTASYSNLNAAPNTITIDCGAGATTPTVTATGCTGTTGSCTGTCNYPAVTSPASSQVSATASGTACSTTTVTNNPPNVGGATTVGTLSLAATYESISVYAPFSGDTNANNNATLDYKISTSPTWIRGHEMYIDRNARIQQSRTTSYFNNPYVNQSRASVLLASPCTQYDVRVTFTDPDGVSGSPVTGTIRTRCDPALGSGTTYYVSTTGSDSNPGTEAAPFATIQRAANAALAGNTVLVKAGTYTGGITLPNSGTSSNYITFMPFGTDAVTIQGSTNHFVITDKNYIRIKGFRFSASTGSSISISGSNAHDIVIEDSIFDDPAIGGGYAESALRARSGAFGITFQRNTVTRITPTTGDNTFGIYLQNSGGGHVVRKNTITGRFRDGLGGEPNYNVISGGLNGGPHKDTDIYNNTISGCADDGIEAEGPQVNVRVWNNVIKNCLVGIGIAPQIVGPSYTFRNILHDNTNNAFKLGELSRGKAYVYHNTIYSRAGNGIAASGGSGADKEYANFVFYNNLVDVPTRPIELGRPNNIYNYDNLFSVSTFVSWCTNQVGTCTQVNYATLSDFQATGKELNGISIPATNEFVSVASGDFRLKSGSLLIDKGVVINGLNDLNSQWRYNGNAPDMGAFEFLQAINRFYSPTFDTPLIVDGSSIIIRMNVEYNESNVIKTFRFSKPSYVNMSNYRINESGTIKPVTDLGTEIEWLADTSRQAFLLFDIPAPRKTRDLIITDNGTFYRKEITISAENSFTNVQASAAINPSYPFWKLYELQGANWVDVTAQYNLQISGSTAAFSGFSLSAKEFRLEGTSSPPPTTTTISTTTTTIPGATTTTYSVTTTVPPVFQPTPSPSGGGGGSGGVYVPSAVKPESIVIENKTGDVPKTGPGTEVKKEGDVSIDVIVPDIAESGELFNVNVILRSKFPIKHTVKIKVNDQEEVITIPPNGEEKNLSMRLRAPVANGSFTVQGIVDDGKAIDTENIKLDFKPLVLSVNKTQAKGIMSVIIDVYDENLSTELQIFESGKIVYFDKILGKKHYATNVTVLRSGEYMAVAKSTTPQGEIVDIDTETLQIEGSEEIDYRLILIVVAVISVAAYFVSRKRAAKRYSEANK